MKENFATIKEGNIEEGRNNRQRYLDRDKKREEARWFFPPENWYKANFDGAVRGNLGPAGSGGII